MRTRLLLLAALLPLGCAEEADPPPGGRPDPPGAMPPPVEPDNLEAEDADEALLEETLDDEATLFPPTDDAPPDPVPILAATGSCDARAVEPLCFAFTGTGWTLASAQAECAASEAGVFLSSPCPTDGRIGECVHRPEGDAAREIVYSFYAPMDPLIAEAVCPGTFRAL